MIATKLKSDTLSHKFDKIQMLHTCFN